MFEIVPLLIFLTASFALIVVPGPAVLYVVVSGLEKGPKVGAVSALGIAAGGFLQVALSAVGLSALLLTSARAFNLVKILGAAYLIFLGISSVFS